MPARRTIYLDHAATTAVDRRVVHAMAEVWTDNFGNPSSRHPIGLAAQQALRRARTIVARSLAADPRRVIFTSGGTEALGLALLGSARKRRKPGQILISGLEHAAIRQSAALAAREGHRLCVLSVDGDGRTDPEAVAAALTPDTFLACVMHVSNETGIEQPLPAIADLIARRQPSCLLLVDAVQSLGRLPVSLTTISADLLVASAHKLHGPKGVGVLALSERARIAPLWGGGDQEAGLRAGTENVPGIVGLATALALCGADAPRLRAYSQRLEDAVRSAVPGARPLGNPRYRVAHIVTLRLPQMRSDVVVNALAEEGLCVSSGSACDARSTQRSPTLAAMGVPDGDGVLRLSLSDQTSDEEIDQACALIATTLPRLNRRR